MNVFILQGSDVVMCICIKYIKYLFQGIKPVNVMTTQLHGNPIS